MSQYIFPSSSVQPPSLTGDILAPRLEFKGDAATDPLERLVRIVDKHGITHYVRPSMVQRIYGRSEKEAKEYGLTAVVLSNGSRGLVFINGDWSPDEIARTLGLLEQAEGQRHDTYTIEGGVLARWLNSAPSNRQEAFVKDFLVGLSPENYYRVCAFVSKVVSKNPKVQQ